MPPVWLESPGLGVLRPLVLAVPLLLVGGAAPWMESATTPPADGTVDARVAFDEAQVEGNLDVAAPAGALLLAGPRTPLILHADALRLTVVQVEKAYVDNPLGADVAVVLSHREDAYEFRDAVLQLAPQAPAALVYLYRDAPGDAPVFHLALGHVTGAPFVPMRGPSPVEVTEANQAYGFEHVVAPPAFGVERGGADAPFAAPFGPARVEGDVAGLVDFLTLQVADADHALSLTMGERRDHDAPAGPLHAAYHVNRTYARLDATGARLDTDLSEGSVRFLTPTPTYHLDGTLRVPSARGDLQHGAVHAPMRGDALLLAGDLTITPQATPAPPGLISLDGRDPGVQARVAGDARDVRVNGVAVGPPPLPAPLRDASAVALLLGSLALAWTALQKLAAGALVPMYARLTGRVVLDSRSRQRILREVASQPFVHLRGLERATGLGYGSVAYHASVLKREGLLASVPTAREELFYRPVAGFGRDDMRRLALLAQPTRARIAAAVARAEGASQEDLAVGLGLDRGLVCRQLGTLERAGLVESTGARGKAYRATALLQRWLARPTVPTPAVGAPLSSPILALHAPEVRAAD